MSSDTDTSICSYQQLLDSEREACCLHHKTGSASRHSPFRKLWFSSVVVVSFISTIIYSAAFVVVSWRASKNLDEIQQLAHQNLGANTAILKHLNEGKLQEGSLLIPPFAAPQTVTIDGVEISGYRLKYNASYCDEFNDPAGAAARGCVLDRVQGSWVPEVCSDWELREAWEQMPEFNWYLDEARTIKVPQERVYRGDADLMGRSLYTDVNYHINHCIAVMRLRNKNSLRRNRGLTYHMLSDMHIEHCYDRFLDWLTPEGIKVTKKPTEIRFSSAGVVWNKDEKTSECYVPI